LHAKTEKGKGVPPGISCADLVPGSGDDSFDTLPASGGIPLVVMLVTPLALILAGVTGVLALRRRITFNNAGYAKFG
jgi:hypothetical protein